METNLSFAEALKKVRKEKKMTQAELAKRTGISLISIKRYESGTIPDMGKLAAICVALQDDELLIDSWTYSDAQKRGNAIGRQEQAQTYIKVKDVAHRKYWDEVVRNGTWEFQNKLVYIAQTFQNMNSRGIREVLTIADALSKAPDYQAKKPWAFKPDSSKEDITNDEGEAESE